MQQHPLRHIFVIATLFLCVNANAFMPIPLPLEKLDDLETLQKRADFLSESQEEEIIEKSPTTNVNRIYSTVQVSRNYSISPMRLCHNGLHLYFRDQENCEEFGIKGFNCKGDLEIAPLRSAEEIYLKEGGKDFITRFFHIDTRYYFQEVNADNGVLLKNERRRIPYCKDVPKHTTRNIRRKRVVRTEGERIFVASLIDQSKLSKEDSFLIINSPIGNIDHHENLTSKDIDKELNNTLARFPVKSPFCSGFNQDLVWQMSGEYTGGGSRDLQPASLQLISQPVFIKRKIWRVNKETGKMEQRYEFTCEQVWDL